MDALLTCWLWMAYGLRCEVANQSPPVPLCPSAFSEMNRWGDSCTIWGGVPRCPMSGGKPLGLTLVQMHFAQFSSWSAAPSRSALSNPSGDAWSAETGRP